MSTIFFFLNIPLIFAVLLTINCWKRRKRNLNLTIADQSDSVLCSERIIAQSTVGVVITVLEPLQIWLHNTLREKMLITKKGYCDATSFAQICATPCVHPLTLLWLETRQCSHTFTRCSKQNKLVTFLFGHLQRPMATWNLLRTNK